MDWREVYDAVRPDWFAHRAIKSFEGLTLKVRQLLVSLNITMDDAAANPDEAGEIQRNGANLFWHNGSAAQQLNASGGSAPADADYLVGTTNGGLSSEIVVGTAPGGELGGTWAAPTVDATHSGSAHVTDHGALSGLADDDHPQYATDTDLSTHAAAADPHTVYLKETDFDDIDFLVGTATGFTAAEIVVGTSPGGELGGTWAAPTVDATHSGSAHHDALTLGADIDAIVSLVAQVLSLDTQTANLIFAGPSSGGAADPTFRSLVAADMPAGLLAADRQLYTANDTWTNPLGSRQTMIICIGGGGGGGSGRRDTAGSARSGGGGGGSGAFSVGIYPTGSLPDSVAVTVGAVGTGGAAQAATPANGNNGVNGGQSSFGAFVTAPGGGLGGGGTGATGAAGAAGAAGTGNHITLAGTAGGAGDETLAVVGVNALLQAAAGGGGGGGVLATNVECAGADGGDTAFATAGNTGGTVGGNPGGSPTDQTTAQHRGGQGGGGGGAGHGEAGGSGGVGADWGGGGGGGSGANTTQSGAGGNGGAGIVVVISV